jgi:hypothetical protein
MITMARMATDRMLGWFDEKNDPQMRVFLCLDFASGDPHWAGNLRQHYHQRYTTWLPNTDDQINRQELAFSLRFLGRRRFSAE